MQASWNFSCFCSCERLISTLTCQQTNSEKTSLNSCSNTILLNDITRVIYIRLPVSASSKMVLILVGVLPERAFLQIIQRPDLLPSSFPSACDQTYHELKLKHKCHLAT